MRPLIRYQSLFQSSRCGNHWAGTPNTWLTRINHLLSFSTPPKKLRLQLCDAAEMLCKWQKKKASSKQTWLLKKRKGGEGFCRQGRMLTCLFSPALPCLSHNLAAWHACSRCPSGIRCVNKHGKVNQQLGTPGARLPESLFL